MTKLLPCPFCGGEAELHPTYDMDTGEMDGYFVICRNKNCTVWPETDEYLTEAEAIAAWNTRAERTCEMRADGAHCMNGVEFYECRSCGEYACVPTAMGKSEPPNYCPNCGAKVVGE